LFINSSLRYKLTFIYSSRNIYLSFSGKNLVIELIVFWHRKASDSPLSKQKLEFSPLKLGGGGTKHQTIKRSRSVSPTTLEDKSQFCINYCHETLAFLDAPATPDPSSCL
jgi:hypothetical protein